MFGAAGVGVALLLVLGLPLACASGLRGYWMLGAAPAFAMTMIAGTSVIAPWVGAPWSVLPVMAVTVVVGAGILVARRMIRTRTTSEPAEPSRPSSGVWLTLALVVAAVVIGARMIEVIGAPGNISQTFDNIFHLNGIRFILDGGNASPLRLGYMTSPDGSLPFYPAVWHAFTSLIVQLTGVSIPVAVNAAMLTTSAFIWPISIVLLTRTLFGGRPAYTVAAALVAASIPAFPMLLMDYGVLYPLQLSLALLPVALAATLALLRISPVRAPRGVGWWALILVGAIPGMTLAHPGAFVAWLALSVPMVLLAAWRAWRAAATRGRVMIGAGVVVYAVVGAVLVRVLRPPAEARGWPVSMSIPDAFWTVASVSMWYLVPAVVIALSVVAGIVWAVVDRRAPGLLAMAMYLVAVLLFVTVAALPWPALRDALTGSWYNNLPRIASILAIAMVPVAAYGLGRTCTALSSLRPLAGSPRWVPAALGAVAGTAVLAGMQLPVMPSAVSWAQPLYALDAASPLLTADEYALLTRIPDHVPEGVAIAGSPWTGASLASAIGGRPVLMPHTLMVITDEVAQVNDGLDTATPGSAVCAAVRDLHVGFVLDFGGQEVHNGVHDFPGFDALAQSDRVRLVDEQGAARLYEVVACG
ncbi:DUF6541 family protein [Microbacterium sp. CJ88]|uniref:DUF6541 family protein n=1 Tax=Microbacterium sp. CJ88 TaxID=3445672 RepID=UPI003F65E377